MALDSSTARSISQVSRESMRVELQGSVQTVFPIHECMTSTANSETQDYGTLGNDGPLEGATKVFQVTLRDLSEVQGGLHRINAYFYDSCAEKHCRLSPGECIAVSGPAESLVRPDPSAGSGDHPLCLVFHTIDNDDVGGPDGASADEVKCELVTNSGLSTCNSSVNAGRTGKGGVSARGRDGRRRPGSRTRGGTEAGGDGGSGEGASTRSGVKKGAKSYVYTKLASLRFSDERANVYGIVCSFNHPHQSRGRDMTISVSLLDESRIDSDNAVPCNFFQPTRDGLPVPLMVGDIIRIHRAKIQVYRDRPQLLGIQGVSWLLVRKKQDARQTFQRGIAGEGAGSGGDGGGIPEYLDPAEDSPPSGPDAGGGEADAFLPEAEWEVRASSANYTLSQVDHDRCNALHAWLVDKAPHLWLKPSAERKTWVQDVFRRPMSGPIIAELEVDLVCCLVSKHEKSGGGAGSLNIVYVADGTGFANSPAGNEWDGPRDAALTKGMRFALSDPGWSPRDPRPPPYPAHLKVEIITNNKEWEALGLSPGMWIRLRRLTVLKNRETATMSALMKDPGASVNPLHPGMAEVQVIAKSYAAHCGRSGSRTNVGGASRNSSSTSSSKSPVAPFSDDASAREFPSGRPASLASGEVAPVTPPPGAPQQEREPTAVQLAGPPPGVGSRREHISNVDGFGDSSGAAKGGTANDGTKDDAESYSGRSSKRARLVPQAGTKDPRAGTGPGGTIRESASSGGGSEVSHLGTVRSTRAPSEFDTRVRVVSHFPSQVRDFVQRGPESSGDLRFLFALRLEDDHGIVDALVSGGDASRLLPGAPSPVEFGESETARKRVEQTLARLESQGAGAVPLRLRSYVTPVAGGLRVAGSKSAGISILCKRFSIIAPSPLIGEWDAEERG